MRGSTWRSVSGHRRTALEILAEEAIGRDAEVERGLGGVLDDRGAVFLRERQDAEHPPDAGRAFVVVDDGADRADATAPAVVARPRSASVVGGVRAGRSASWMRCQPRGARRCSRSSCPVFGSSRRTCRSFHCTWTPLTDPAGRRAVVGGLDFDAAIEMDRALAEPVVAKRLDAAAARAPAAPRQTSRRPGASSCRGCACRPSASPSDRVRLRGLERLEAQSVQRRLLRVADAGFDFAFAIGIADATRQRDDAVVGEHVAIERIERGVVDVGREHALFQVVEDDHVSPCRRGDGTRARAAHTRSAALDRQTSSRTALRE